MNAFLESEFLNQSVGSWIAGWSIVLAIFYLLT
jgi:hypothetical protein